MQLFTYFYDVGAGQYSPGVVIGGNFVNAYGGVGIMARQKSHLGSDLAN